MKDRKQFPLSRILPEGVNIMPSRGFDLWSCGHGGQCGEYGCLAATVFNNGLKKGGSGVDQALRKIVKEQACPHLSGAVEKSEKAWIKAGGKSIETLQEEIECLRVEHAFLVKMGRKKEARRVSQQIGAKQKALNRALDRLEQS